MPDYAPPIVRAGLGEVVASGSVVSYRSEPIQIEFGPPNDRLTVMFAFYDDPLGLPSEVIKTKTEWSVESSDPRMVVFTLRNFRGIGAGNDEPIRLGTLAGRPLFCNFRVVQMGNEKVLHYAFYTQPPGGFESRLTDMLMKHYGDTPTIRDLIKKDR